jgi:predicted Zn-dependent peptidase
LANCTADNKVLESLIERAITERNDLKTNKSYIQYLQKTYAAYGEDNPERYALNSNELKALTIDELVKIIKSLSSYPHAIRYYGPRSISSVTSTINTLHQSAKTKTPIPASHQFTQKKINENKVYFTPFDAVQVEISWIRNDVAIDNKDVPYTTLFNQYFGGNMSALVFQTIRESKALAYATNAQFQTPAKAGELYTMSAYVGTQADKMPEAIVAMNELPYSEGSFAQAKNAIFNKIESERIRGNNIFGYQRSAQLRNQKDDSRQWVYKNINSLTFDDMKKFHASHIAINPYQYTVLGDKSKVNMDELKKYGTIVEVSIDELMGEK